MGKRGKAILTDAGDDGNFTQKQEEICHFIQYKDPAKYSIQRRP